MTTATEALAPRSLPLAEKLLLVAIAYFVALKLYYSFTAAPFGDEAYYWMWGRHPALSYFDHPPLQGWLQGLSYLLFGRSLFALRWLTWVCFAAVLWLFYLVARRMAGEDWRPVFLRSTAVYVAVPLFGFFTSVAIHDYLLVTLVMWSGYLFIRYFAAVEETGSGRLPQLFGAALLLGLAGLTKYNAAFLGLAVAAAVLIRPRLRPLLLGWPIYLAGLVTLALQLPVLLWNLRAGYASFAYQLGSRHGSGYSFKGINLAGMQAFVGEALLMVSPVLVVPLALFFLRPQATAFGRVGKTLAILMFWLSSLTCLYLANSTWVIWWWNILAFVLFLPFSGLVTSGWVMGVLLFWGAVVNTFLIVSYAAVPVLALFGLPPGMETERNYGWTEVIATMQAAATEHGAEFFVTNRFETASQIGFVLDAPDGVVSLTAARESYDDWFDPETRRGQGAIVLVDPEKDNATWRTQFASVTDLGPLPAKHPAGYVLRVYELYYAEGFAPPPAQQ